MKRGFSATTKVNRKDFGVSWNKSLDGGGVVVGDEVKISIEGELEAKK
jgi:polyisoprenoid-binding protein YceI